MSMPAPSRYPCSIASLVGNTPVLELLLRVPGRLLLKLEKLNPGGSMKDRMALSMLEDAERSGRLRRGGTIVESSSGNTGTALAMLAAERGYRFVVVVDDHAASEKVRTMRAYGAEIVRVAGGGDGQVATLAREALARQLGSELPGGVFLNQADNPSNGAGYEQSLASEIHAATAGDIDVLVGAVGTGGSLSGTSRGLRDRGVNVRVVAVEPEGSIIFGGPPHAYFQSGTGTPAGVHVGANVDRSVISEARTVSDAAAFSTARFLARRRGLLVGGAAGGVVFSALQTLAASEQPATVVALVADGGEKYLDTVFDDAWLRERDLHDPGVERWLGEVVATAPQTSGSR